MPPTADRRTCNVLGWTVFGPGYHKSELYSPSRCNQIVTNYKRLRPFVVPRVLLGHDAAQRFAESLGFPSLGTVTDVRPAPGRDGFFCVDLHGVPVEVGEQIAAGRLPTGSIELVKNVRDPADHKTVPGDVMTAVALLGDEQPVVKGLAPPRATFADGTPVPPARGAARWLQGMATVLAKTADGRRRLFATIARETYPAVAVAFSEMTPCPPTRRKTTMAPTTRRQKFADDPGTAKTVLKEAGFSDDDVATILDVLGIGQPDPVPAETMGTVASMSDLSGAGRRLTPAVRAALGQTDLGRRVLEKAAAR